MFLPHLYKCLASVNREVKAYFWLFLFQDTQLEERIYRTYTDCILAGRPLTEFDLYTSANLDLKSAGIE